MNNRIKQFMDYKGLSSSELADLIGVQRSNITHVLHGRNKPGFQFITKMLEAFPEMNAKWLLTGEGEMLTSTPEKKVLPRQEDLFSPILPPSRGQQEETPSGAERDEPEGKQDVVSMSPADKKKGPPVETDPMSGIFQSLSTGNSKKIESVVIFYTDQTFRHYTPSN
ncbi:MAG: helix-turn-helix domain-containing protein [Mangrovibacterium sp.]